MAPRSRADLRVLLRDLASGGTTILLSSHILSEMEEMVDGVVFMSHGTAVASPSGWAPAPDQAGSGAATPVAVRRTWRMRALDAGRLRERARSPRASKRSRKSISWDSSTSWASPGAGARRP